MYFKTISILFALIFLANWVTDVQSSSLREKRHLKEGVLKQLILDVEHSISKRGAYGGIPEQPEKDYGGKEEEKSDKGSESKKSYSKEEEESEKSSDSKKKSYDDEGEKPYGDSGIKKKNRGEEKESSQSKKVYKKEENSESNKKSYDDEEESYKPKKKNRGDDSDDYKPRRKPYDDDDEGYKPRRKPYDDDDEGYKPRRKSYDDEDEGYKPRRKPHDDEDEGYKPRRKSYDDDDEGYQPRKPYGLPKKNYGIPIPIGEEIEKKKSNFNFATALSSGLSGQKGRTVEKEKNYKDKDYGNSKYKEGLTEGQQYASNKAFKASGAVDIEKLGGFKRGRLF